VNLTAWKLAAFGVSAGLAGLAGGLLAAGIGSVSAGAYTFQQSLAVVAIATVVGVRSIGAAAVGGIFLIFGPEAADRYAPVHAVVPADRRVDPDRPGHPYAARPRSGLAGALPQAVPTGAAVPRLARARRRRGRLPGLTAAEAPTVVKV